MLSKKKKIIILSCMVVLLVATGVLNVVLNRKPSESASGGSVGAGNFFDTYRQDRVTTRSQTIIYLDAIIASAQGEAKTNAEAQKLELVAVMEKELILEGLIKSFGFEDCIVTMSTDNVNIIVKSEELTEQEVAQILHCIVTETGKPATQIRVIPVE